MMFNRKTHYAQSVAEINLLLEIVLGVAVPNFGMKLGSRTLVETEMAFQKSHITKNDRTVGFYKDI